MSSPPVNWRDHVLGALLGLVYIVVLLGTARELAMSRDESFYVIAADQYAGWFELLARDPARAMTAEAVDKFWKYNHEHPGLVKSVFALSSIAQRKLELFSVPTMAHRFGGMLSAGLLLWLIYLFGARGADRLVGLFAALAFAMLPRVFYHSHLNCFDLPIVLMLTWTVYAYWRSLDDPRWALVTGLAYGCALATKHNSWILPAILLVHWVWVSAHEWQRRKQGAPASVHIAPWWLLGMVLIGPLIFYGTWPWLWHDTLARVQEYAAFHLHHAYYHIVYFGETYFRPPFPVSYPFVMTLYTVPLTFCALCIAGVAVRYRSLLPMPLHRLLRTPSRPSADARCTDVLWFGCMLAPMLLIALPSTPIFGGTKHWFPAYPFAMLFAGYAALRVMVAAESWVAERQAGDHRWAGVVVLSVILLPGFVETAHSHPFGLSHYTLAAGGVPGAADRGMNRQFWGFTTGSVVDFLRERLPDGGTVYTHDTTWKAWRMLQLDGRLPANIRPARNLSQADYVLVHHEEHMVEVDFQAWQAFGSVQPVHVLTYDGVPIVTIYEHPRRRSIDSTAAIP